MLDLKVTLDLLLSPVHHRTVRRYLVWSISLFSCNNIELKIENFQRNIQMWNYCRAIFACVINMKNHPEICFSFVMKTRENDVWWRNYDYNCSKYKLSLSTIRFPIYYHQIAKRCLNFIIRIKLDKERKRKRRRRKIIFLDSN